MSQLQEKINNDLKQAMREKDELKLSTLRLLNAALKNKAIALRSGEAVELTDEQIIEVSGSEIKKRKDSVEAYTAGGRVDLADRENAEIKILEKYMPEQLSDEEIERIVRDIVDSGAADFGRVMGQAMGRLKSRADGKKVGEIVKKVLGL